MNIKMQMSIIIVIFVKKSLLIIQIVTMIIFAMNAEQALELMKIA